MTRSAYDIGGLLQGLPCNRAELAAQAAALKPLGAMVDPADLACMQANADLLPADYANVLVTIADATTPGKNAKLLRYGVGLGCGAVIGLLIGKFVL